jgi:carboxypeptidase Q
MELFHDLRLAALAMLVSITQVLAAEGRPSTPPASAPAVRAAPATTRPAQAEQAGENGEGLRQRYGPAAERIIQAALSNSEAWRKLEELCDDIGHRLTGSEGLERAIEWAVRTLSRDGHENVRTEAVTAPKWVRGAESLEMLEPRPMPLAMLGLGGSVSTPPEGITAEVVAVRDLEHLTSLGEQVRGKIVLFDYPMSRQDEARGGGYGSAAQYRVYGARWASQHGAVAALVRSATTRSLQTPHTGAMSYADAPERIPAACVTTETAAMITRFQQRGISVRMRLKMEARSEGTVQSANVIAELCGSERPEEIVLIGGHLDSWDVGQGAHDDGGGCVTAMEALRILRVLELRPRRTIRLVLFTNEENGLAGGRTYAREHQAELARHVAAIEADAGTFQPTGFAIDHEDATIRSRAATQLRRVLELLEPLGAMEVREGHSAADISPMRASGVVLMGQCVDMTHYFDFHHTHADTLDKVAPEDLNRNVAALAVVAYVLADMPGRLGSSAEWTTK